MSEERKMLRRLVTRLKSARASVMLEFAFVAPLVAVTAIFAADFTRILRTEQQLEIATRLAADVEAHLADYYAQKKAQGEEDAATPCSITKVVTKYYLVDVAHVAERIGDVYMKGSCAVIKNPISVAVNAINKFLAGETFSAGSDSAGKIFVNLLGKILGGLMNFATFRTIKYLTDVVPHDREVKVAVATYIPTILPDKAYASLALPGRGGTIGVASFAPDLTGGAAATAWNLKLEPNKRHRVYCYMPVVDSVPVAPETYVRKFKSWCAQQPFIGGLAE